MRIARVAWAGGAAHAYVEDGGFALVDDPYAVHARHTGVLVPFGAARVLAPVQPRTVLGMAHNTGAEDRLRPAQAFLKPPSTVIGPEDAIPLPPGIGRVDAEAEVAVVIGRTARHLTVRDAASHVLGVTVGNDVTARDLQGSDPLWTTAKGHDGFTPLGPWITTGLDLDDLEVGLSIDGRALRPGSTAELARTVVECLVHVTSFLTLAPGDVLLTGAPGECGPIHPGQRVTASVRGVGELGNRVVAARAPRAEEAA